MQSSLNIIIIVTGGDGFPNGGAYINRIISLAKGLIKNGNDVSVLVTYPGNKRPENYEGVYEGIKYDYTVRNAKPKSKIETIKTGLIGTWNAIRFLRRNNKEKKIDCIISGTGNIFQNTALYLFTHFHNTPLIREKNEYPLVVLHKEKYSKLYVHLYLKYYYKLFNGLLVINNKLKSFYGNKLRKGAKQLLVPMIVEPERFNLPVPQQNTISFCGHLWGSKDGVPILVEAFSLIAKKFPDYKLQLIGRTDTHPQEYENVKAKIRGLGIADQVVFTGFVDRESIPKYLCSSKLLVLARPESKQAEGGFPTKLGEYLATGNPVVVTSVGEIPEFLQDGVDVFMAKPGDVKDFAEQMSYALSHSDLAKKIGENGRKIANTTFNYSFQGERITDFIQLLK